MRYALIGMEESGDKAGWGGARPGSGRPRVVRDPERMVVDFEKADLDVLREVAGRRGTSLTELIRRAVSQYARRARKG